MEKKDLLPFLATFLFGVFTGGYLYYVGWSPQMNELDTPPTTSRDTVAGDELEIVGEQYGACASSSAGCPQFRLNESREYRIVWIDENGSVVDSQAGQVSRQDWQNVYRLFVANYEDGTASQLSSESSQCLGSPTGWMYSVSLSAGEQLSFDECVTENYELIDQLKHLRQVIVE